LLESKQQIHLTEYDQQSLAVPQVC